jgi:citrate lyase alpha subunit
MLKCKKPIRIVEALILTLKESIQCSSLQVFFIEQLEQRHKVPETINLQKTVFDNRYITCVNLKDEELVDIQVKSKKEASKP